MSDKQGYPRRLIEVDLPIRQISEHSRREKSIRQGHISTLHMWWARRPLGACRAVALAALLPDPADERTPVSFVSSARRIMREVDERKRGRPRDLSGRKNLRAALLDFIATFSSWEASIDRDLLEASRALVKAAATDKDVAGRPLVLDPFAGGGSIPLEALRVGADSFATDLNPVPVVLNHVILEMIPRFGAALADELLEVGRQVEQRIEKRLAQHYPKSHERPPVAYIWARQISCEGPGCGVRVPLIRSLVLVKKGRASVGLLLKPDRKENRIDIKIEAGRSSFEPGTVRRGSATCPLCGYTTPVGRVREQLKRECGGADDSRLVAVVCRGSGVKTYHEPTARDLDAVAALNRTFKRSDALDPIELPAMSGVFNAPLYGMTRWDLLYSKRQLLSAMVIGDEIGSVCNGIADEGKARALRLLLFLARGKYLDFRSTLCGWISTGEKIGHTFGRQALGMIFDWAEGTPTGNISGAWPRCYEAVAEFVRREGSVLSQAGNVQSADAQALLLPDDSVAAVITDPPYYNAVPYADLSDYFYVWLRRDLLQDYPELFQSTTAPKDAELCEMQGWDPVRYPNKDSVFYENGMRQALEEARRVCRPDGIGVVVFAHKTTTGWETILSALIKAGWVVTGSWPIDTERAGRLRAMRSAALGSSVHLVCRPLEREDGSLIKDTIGDWGQVLRELPSRIHEWLPRLADEGVVGADAIFACLGPALEIFSRYARVEKVSGEEVELREYLEHVWAAVSREALAMLFDGVETAGLEPDARVTAMWLWTLSTSTDSEAIDSDEDSTLATFGLEYDAARKIAQGLGAQLEELEHVVEVKGDKARLLAVHERTKRLFGKAEGFSSAKAAKKKQMTLFGELDAAAEAQGWGEVGAPKAGTTTLDRVHQAMLLFGAGRGEALKRFLVEEGVGREAQFWKLAQSLLALYPPGTDENRWVDGVLARKKRLGFG